MMFFGNDSMNMNNNGEYNKVYMKRKYEVNFSILQYLEFFTYHAIGFLVLGPFTILLVPFFWKNCYWVYNLQFFRCSIACFLQYLMWFTNVLSYILVWRGDSVVGDASMIYFIITINLLRSSIIAGKYATYPPEYLRKVRRMPLTTKEIDAELMLAYWFMQSDDLIRTEVNSSIDRL